MGYLRSIVPLTRTARIVMNAVQDPIDFQPHRLSVREREIVDLAVEGHTDEQIAQALTISTSTVNSYWVRVRGKVGQLSRTEVVAKMLHHGYKEGQDGLLAEVARLTGLLATSDHSLAQSKSDLSAERGTSWHLLALHFVPEAVLVAEHPGTVVYANLQAERLFHCEPGGLVGREVCVLTVPEEQNEKRKKIRAFMEADVPGRMLMGVEEPSYALDGDGGNFRATIAVEGFDAPEGFMAVFTVREFLGDMDAVLRSLRRPLVVG